MEKKLFYSTFALIIFMLLISCGKKTNFEQSIYFVENIQQIQDSIVKLKTYNVKLIICSLKKTTNHTIIKLSSSYTPYHVQNDFKYKNIHGVNVLFIDYKEKLTNREIPLELLGKNILIFDGPSHTADPSYWEFIFCENDLSSVKCFDKIQLDDFEQEYRKNKKRFNKDMLVKKCN